MFVRFAQAGEVAGARRSVIVHALLRVDRSDWELHDLDSMDEGDEGEEGDEGYAGDARDAAGGPQERCAQAP